MARRGASERPLCRVVQDTSLVQCWCRGEIQQDGIGEDCFEGDKVYKISVAKVAMCQGI